MIFLSDIWDGVFCWELAGKKEKGNETSEEEVDR